MPSQSSKRAIETIDLTDEDGTDFSFEGPWPPSKRSKYENPDSHGASSSSNNREALTSSEPNTAGRSAHSRSSFQAGIPPQPSESVRESWQAAPESLNAPSSTQAFDVFAEVADDQDSGGAFDSERAMSLVHYGTISTMIVGLRYYKGLATRGEYVLVKREPSNPYDRNAMRVDNVNHEQVGHIKRNMAAKVAPFMDDKSLMIEAKLAGHVDIYEAPVDLLLWGTSEESAKEQLKKRMRDAKLPTNLITQAEREKKQQEKEAAKQAKQLRDAERKRQLQQAAATSGGMSRGDGLVLDEKSSGTFANLRAPGDGNGDGPDMNEIMQQATSFDPREMHNIVNKYAASEKVLSELPKAGQPAEVHTKMLPHQLQALAWLLDRESPELTEKGSENTVQLWKHNRDGSFTNVATNYSVSTPPRLASGGILADDMGLGKTIEIISLIVADPRRVAGSPTLILAPLSVMSNWSGQFETHLKSSCALKVLTYHGQSKNSLKAKDLQQSDVVITTYQTMASEFFNNKTSSPIFKTKWRRVVVDEGHNLRNPKSKMAVAACGLDADSRWILTGTPIVNSLKDLYSHMKFIKITGGLEQSEVFEGALVRPLNRGDSSANLLLQALMGSFCLRRMKDMKFIDLSLPPLSSHKYGIEFKPHEREKYELFEREAKGVLDAFQQKKADGSVTYSTLLEVLLRMRQTCNHWQLTGARLTDLISQIEANKVATLTPENTKMLQGLLQVSIDSQEDCPICLEVMHSPVITCCAHAFDRECIEKVIETQHKCPMCRAPLKDDKALVEPAAGGEDVDTKSTEEATGVSTKLEALMNILKASDKKKGTKTVVFSQWARFLDVVQRQVEDSDIDFARIDGSLHVRDRDLAMSRFQKDPDCPILLATLGVCSVGLNLTAANQVILCDSWWAPAIEDQAIDRVYRLGQTRPVQVFRLVVENTIETRVLDIQKDKRKLMMTAFGDAKMNRGNEKSAKLADIERLLT